MELQNKTLLQFVNQITIIIMNQFIFETIMIWIWMDWANKLVIVIGLWLIANDCQSYQIIGL